MSFVLECKKLKRTAMLPALLFGGILSSAFPIVNLLVRADSFIHLSKAPLEILMDANWMLMAMLNSFLMILGACILYNIEFADNAIQLMDALPITPGKLFLNKFLLLAFSFVIVFAIEGTALYFCSWKWFSVTEGFVVKLLKVMAYSYLMSLPVLALMLSVASYCKNMWITLGIGVIGIFTVQMLSNVGTMKYFPFMMPYQPSIADTLGVDSTFCIVAAVETVVFLVLGIVLSKIRRNAA